MSAQEANLVVNGGFEAPVIPMGGYQVFSSIPGWAIPAGHPQFELQRRVAGDPFEGEQHCELDAFVPATIFQDVPTSPGQAYDLRFAFSPRPGRPATDNVLRVSWGGAVVTTLVADGTGLSTTSWNVHQFQVTGGPGATTRLTFEDLGTANTYGTYIDDVRVVESTIVTPPNLLVNGSFEQGPSIPPGSSHTTVPAGSTAIPGWAVTGGTVDYFGPSWTLADGARGIDLDGAFSTGGIQQTVGTVPGDAYVVSFALAGNLDGAPRVKRVRFEVDGLLHDLEFDTLGRTRAEPGWERVSVAFVASGTSATVSFVSLSPAGNSWGAMIDDVSLVRQPAGPQPATDLRVHAIAGNVVTVRWTAPALGPTPTGYILEGGRLPGETLASIPTGDAEPVFTFTAPTGSFYVRVHALDGAARSAASNEIRLHVNVPVPPSAPAHLLGLVDGSTLALAWTNTYEGGAPASLILDVSGPFTTSLPIGLTDHFTFAGVPQGTYTLALRARNTAGVSPPSNAVTLTFPGPCSGPPQTPTRLFAHRVGRALAVDWAPATTGPEPTAYRLDVAGAFTGSFATPARALAGTVGPGTYTLSVVAMNDCGLSATSPTRTIVVP